MNNSVNCPTCKKPHSWNKDSPYRPFCCDRCKLIDLGEWSSENYAIAGEDIPISDEEKSFHY